MKVQMKNQDLIELWQLFQRLSMKEMKVKASWAIMKNMQRLEPEMKILQDASAPYPQFKEYEEKRIEYCEEYCKRSAQGAPLKTHNLEHGQDEYEIPDERKDEFTDKVEALKVEYKDAIEAQQQRDSEWRELLNEETEVDLYMFHERYLPDTLAPLEAKIISRIVEEESEPESSEK